MKFDQLIFAKIIQYKKYFVWFSWVINYAGLTVVAISVFLSPFYLYWTRLGDMMGNLAVVTFCFSLLPGILKRFQVAGSLKLVQVLLMTFRRQLGVMMYFFVFEHYLWVRLMPSVKFSSGIIPNNLYEIMGMLAFLLLTPLFLTSNDFSIKFLGSKWRLLHKSIYLINWLIFFHLLILGRGGWSLVLIYTIGLMEIVSWLVYFKSSRHL